MRDSKVRFRPRTEFAIAGLTTVALIALFWFVERELLWMTGVLLVGIWAPLAARHQETTRRWMPWLALGIVVLMAVGAAIWLL